MYFIQVVVQTVIYVIFFSFTQFVGHSEVLASAFKVIYKPEKSGIYEIYVFCGNILLGGVFIKEVKAGTLVFRLISFGFCEICLF